ncbi:MAG TPA: radical SAM protein [Candidatus Acidoferrales bacterium]|nr:radical SAM protein [Candidatus Acidoferrales bacterium]
MWKKLHLYLIKPSQYDDEGYVVRHWRGVLPSNTLACLAGLTEDVLAEKRLGELLRVKVHLLDETVDHVPVKRICRSQRAGHTKTIVCLVGVQTNQFPRSCDLAREFRRAGLTVMIGGFHVSGYLALLPEIPPDIQQLMDEGVTIVKGEVEETWGDLLCDAVNDQLKPIYDFLNDKPDLYEKPVPVIRKKYLRKFVASNFGTLDCGRGCPFECTFCTIINVQGRKMRFRSAEHIAAAIRRNYQEHGITFYFFTDDNFARNKNWEAIFDALIRLREEEQIPLHFMMQVDVLSWKIKDFVAKARRAGCNTVFIGMESVDPGNLAAAGKKQNHVNEYRQLIDGYRAAGISTHVGYIIGFPFDSAESVRRDLVYLMQTVRPDHASFFMLMPLPGSMDHLLMSRRGAWMHPDFNLYDSHHEVTVHPNLKNGAWKDLYAEAWRTFYSFDNMKAVLRRSPRSSYWNNFLRFLWYKNSVMTEGRHPMMCGFFRLKGRRNRRPGYPILSRWEYCKERAREIRTHLAGMVRILFEMEELWLQTRHPSEAEQRVVEELAKIRAAYGKLKVADLQFAFQRAKHQFPALHVPSKLHLFWAKWSPLLVPNKAYTRADLKFFWSTVRQRWAERRWFHIPLHHVAFNLFRDVQLSFLFFFHLARAR